MNFLEKRKNQLGIKSLKEMLDEGEITKGIDESLFVHGPEEFDLLVTKWSRQEVLSVIGDSSSGKSEVALYFMKHILKNNPNSGGIYVSLEMTNGKLGQRFFTMCKDDSTIPERFFPISRYDKDGKSREIDMDFIKKEVVKYRDIVGDIVVIVIDHIHCMGENDPSTLNSIMIALKEMAVELNCLVIPLAQVNKGAGQKGEVPLDADSVLASSQLKYISSDIIQIHRPIARFEEQAGFSVLGFGYCKIREAHKDDKIKKLQNKLLVYVSENRSFRKMTNDEVTIFKEYYEQLLALKSAEEKQKAFAYDLTKEIVGANGKTVVLREIFTGTQDD